MSNKASVPPEGMLCGGFGQTVVASEEIKKMCTDLRGEIEKAAKLSSFAIFEPLHYRQQVVAGMNYLVKIKVSEEGECVHAKIYHKLPCYGGEITLTSVESGKKLDDEI